MFVFVIPACLFLAALCWKRADLFVLLCVAFYCVFTFLYGVPDQLWYLIISISDLCLPLYFVHNEWHCYDKRDDFCFEIHFS